MNPDLKVVAFHEAGHAVASVLCGHKVVSVDILADEVRWQWGCSDSIFPKNQLEEQWIVAIAGPIAQLWADPKSRLDIGCNSDFEKIDAVIAEMAKRDGKPFGFREIWIIGEKMRATITRMRPYIEAVAKELIERKRMTGEEIEALLDIAEEAREWKNTA